MRNLTVWNPVRNRLLAQFARSPRVDKPNSFDSGAQTIRCSSLAGPLFTSSSFPRQNDVCRTESHVAFTSLRRRYGSERGAHNLWLPLKTDRPLDENVMAEKFAKILVAIQLLVPPSKRAKLRQPLSLLAWRAPLVLCFLPSAST